MVTVTHINTLHDKIWQYTLFKVIVLLERPIHIVVLSFKMYLLQPLQRSFDVDKRALPYAFNVYPFLQLIFLSTFVFNYKMLLIDASFRRKQFIFILLVFTRSMFVNDTKHIGSLCI